MNIPQILPFYWIYLFVVWWLTHQLTWQGILMDFIFAAIIILFWEGEKWVYSEEA